MTLERDEGPLTIIIVHECHLRIPVYLVIYDSGQVSLEHLLV